MHCGLVHKLTYLEWWRQTMSPTPQLEDLPRKSGSKACPVPSYYNWYMSLCTCMHVHIHVHLHVCTCNEIMFAQWQLLTCPWTYVALVHSLLCDLSSTPKHHSHSGKAASPVSPSNPAMTPQLQKYGSSHWWQRFAWCLCHCGPTLCLPIICHVRSQVTWRCFIIIVLHITCIDCSNG